MAEREEGGRELAKRTKEKMRHILSEDGGDKKE